MEASASIVLKAGIDYSEHGLHGLHGMLSVESGQSVVHLSGRYAQKFKKIFFKIIQICIVHCYVFGFIVRHTPAYGHPSPRGDVLTHYTDCQSIINVLSGDRCRAVPSRRGVAEGRGVSHHQKPTIRGVSHCQIGYPSNPVNPWSLIQLWSAIQ